MIRVSTGARLHFGLLDVQAPYGGVGLMIDRPQTVISVEPANRFLVEPDHAVRIIEIARRVAERLPAEDHLNDNGLPACRVTIQAAADPHCGLGSGTQLALATAVALNEFFSLRLSRDELVYQIAARGRRSAIGSIGFFSGGLIAENGVGISCDTPCRWTRASLPDRWRVVLACPSSINTAISGEAERAAFDVLRPATTSQRAELVRLSEQIMQFASSGQFESFCAAVALFNQCSGDLFAPHQGGSYNGPEVGDLIQRLQSLGSVGVGQSSWGPTVFAFCQSDDDAQTICRSLSDVHCQVVKAQNAGYSLARSPSTSCK